MSSFENYTLKKTNETITKKLNSTIYKKSHLGTQITYINPLFGNGTLIILQTQTNQINTLHNTYKNIVPIS